MADLAAGVAHCKAAGYTLHGVVRDWATAYRLLDEGLVTVIVVATREIWAPRIEFADQHARPVTTGGTTNARWRRARVVRRYR